MFKIIETVTLPFNNNFRIHLVETSNKKRAWYYRKGIGLYYWKYLNFSKGKKYMVLPILPTTNGFSLEDYEDFIKIRDAM